MALTGIESMLEESRAHEADEPKVEANPPLTRSVFSYIEPRPGLDGRQAWRTCQSCENWVPEGAMGGAVVGSRCAKYGRDMVVNAEDTCNLYYPFHAGLPCQALVDFNALEIRKGLISGPSAYSMGYKSQCDAKCRTCRWVDFGEPTLAGTKAAECEMFEHLTEVCPTIYDLDKVISPDGGCSLYQRPEQPDPY